MYTAFSCLTRSLAESFTPSSAHLTGVPPRNSCLFALIESTSLPSGSSIDGATVCGRSTSTPVCSIGAATMKITRSTSITSIIGVTLMSELRSPSPRFIAMGLAPSAQEVALDDVQVVVLERLHLGAEHLDAADEEVVRDHRRDRRHQADRRREQGLADLG